MGVSTFEERTGLRVGDSLSESGTLRFAGLPNFAPEILQRVRVKDPLKAKHLKKALESLATLSPGIIVFVLAMAAGIMRLIEHGGQLS